MDKQQDWTCVDSRRVLEEEQHCSYGEDMSSERFLLESQKERAVVKVGTI